MEYKKSLQKCDKITNFYIKNEINSQKTIQNVSKIKKLWGKCDKTYKKSLEKCERIKIMIIHKINRRLTNLESMCTFCSKYVPLEKDEFVATYSRRQYKTCHKTCYNNYLKYVKEVNQKCMK